MDAAMPLSNGQLLRGIGFTAGDEAALQNAFEAVEPVLGSVIDEFLQAASTTPAAAALFSRDGHVEERRAALERWLRRFFTAPRSPMYLDASARLGETTAADDVRPRDVVMAFAVLRSVLGRSVSSRVSSDATLGAIGRGLDLEMVLVLEAYWDGARVRSSSAEVLAGLAHEIRNPLNGAQIHLTLLRRRLRAAAQKDTEMAEAVEVAGAELKRLSRLVTEMIAYASPPALDLAHVDVRQICSRAVSVVDDDAKVASVRIQTELPEVSVDTIADGERMVEVIVSLLRNALEAITLSGRASGVVSVRIIDNDRSVLIEVEDDGPGIYDTGVPIFEPFYTTKPHGSGLGLSVARRAVSDHGGTLSYSSEPGRTVFRIELPGVGQLAATSI